MPEKTPDRSSSPSTHYYIYYRVAPDYAVSAKKAVAALFHAIKSHTGVGGRLLRRRDDPWLWMETYENVADASVFETILAREAAGIDFNRVLVAETKRRTECFVAHEEAAPSGSG